MGTSKVISGEKSLFKAYLCWLVGGLFGLHHIYLGRDRHAFITFATFGGYFTLGLIRDLWRMPEYVRDANNDLEYLDRLNKEMRAHQKPSSGIVRQSALVMMGNLFAHLMDYAIPQELLDDNVVAILRFLLMPLGSALGVWLVGNVGRHKGTLKWPLLAAYLAEIPTLFTSFRPGSFSTLAALLVFNRWCKKWRLERPKPKPIIKRVALLTFCALLYVSLLTSWLYFGCSIEDPESAEPIKCRVALENFAKSDAYQNLSEAIWMLVERVRHHGFVELWKEFMQEFDVSGKASALTTLGLTESASPQDILNAYKKLSRQYHPDREKDPSRKAERQEKFIQVQEAYRVLESTVHRYKMQARSATHDSEAPPTTLDRSHIEL